MTSIEQLSSLLSDVLTAGKGAIPLSISLKEDEEVQRLRNEIIELQERLNGTQAELERAQYLYRCESILNNKLVDLIRENDIALGPEFFQRPY